MGDQSTLAVIASEFSQLLTPLRRAAADPLALQTLFRRLGWNVGPVAATFSSIGDVVADLMALAQGLGDDPSLDAISDAFKAVANVHQALQSQPIPPGTTVEEFARAIFELLVLDYVSARLPKLYTFFSSMGVIQATNVPAQNGRLDYVQMSIDWDQLPKSLSDPRTVVRDIYQWGTSEFDFRSLAEPLREFLVSIGLRAELQPIDDIEEQQAYIADPTMIERGAAWKLDVIAVEASVGTTAVEGGVSIREMPGGTAGPWGIIIEPLVDKSLSGSVALTDTTTLTVSVDNNLPDRLGVFVQPDGDASLRLPFGGDSTGISGEIDLGLRIVPPTPFFVFGRPGATRLEAKGAEFKVGVTVSTAATPEVTFRAGLLNAAVVLSTADLDGFVGSVTPKETRASLDIGFEWSSTRGFGFSGTSAFALDVPLNLTIGPVVVKALHFHIAGEGASGPATLVIETSVDFSATLGPVLAVVQNLGLQLRVRKSDGNLGPFDLSLGLGIPTGVGLSVDAGSVHGGGFISFDSAAGRYFGALQLSIYDIAVSAFALIDTKVPGVSYSFVIIISAQFTPIQLGFGFTLNGVGGMVGINRAIDTAALASLVRAGQSEELLFPKNVIADAPTIVRDLTTVFPATQSHYIFGPLGKLGWGTPTLITGEIGVILQYPGPVVVILGEVKCVLPKPDAALVKLNLSIDGELDFPNKMFAMDAALHDSVINGFPVSGQMAMRVNWGDKPNFIFSIGGFHPAYTPPPDFPKLQPMTLDLGSHGPAKISVSGFFAVTSNTVQVGGTASLHASGSGITLDASVSVKALFVFQPFSFEADIDASVKISFHGYGPSVHLSGVLDGPSPWHIKGEVCVSIIWWDACLGFDVTFGGGQQVTQPAIDPWLGAPSSDPTTTIIGLQTALSDPGNWSAALVPGTVSSVARAQGTDTLIDPVGGLTVRQKTAPVETPNPLTRFGVAKTPQPISFSGVQATLGTAGNTVSLTAVEPVNEFFAPAQFFNMDDGKKLSSAGFEQHQAGYVFATAANKANVQGGSAFTFTPQLVTLQINPDGSDTPIGSYTPSDAKVTAANQRSAVAKGGLTQAGTRRFVNRALVQAFSEVVPMFVIGDNTTLLQVAQTPVAAVRSATLIALDAFRAQNPELAAGLQVTALHELNHG
jgi:uncharacterized protein DUF6603